MKKKSKIFIAGHNGMVGGALLFRLRKEGFTNLLIRTQSQLDLADQRAVRSFFKKEKPEYCFLTSVKEGGIEANIAHPAELLYQNLVIQTNIIHCAWEAGVKRLLLFGSSCVYPRNSQQPMKEEYLLTGALEPTNEPFAVSKIAGIKMCQAYNSQFGTNFISVIPATIFGPNDNFCLKTSHVIPALIRKFYNARINSDSIVTVWGTGRPRREFLYIDDVVDACLFIMRNNKISGIINIGSGEDISIKELAQLIKDIVGFKGKIVFDESRYDGVLQKLLDNSKMRGLGWKAKVSLKEGIRRTYNWYRIKKSKRR